MPEFLPFHGITYATQTISATLGDLCAPPYDVIDPAEREILANRNSHNSVRLILPEDPNGGDPYLHSAALFGAWRAEGILVIDTAEAFYIYKMGYEIEGVPHQAVGVIGAMGLSEPGTEGVLAHERTTPKARSDRMALLKATEANFEPIWGLSLAHGLTELLEVEGPPIARCTDDQGVHHRLYRVEGRGRIAAISDAIAGAPLVLADGHHRYETALAYRDSRFGVGNGDDSRSGEVSKIMTMVIELRPDQLHVEPIHRLIEDLAEGLELRSALSSVAKVEDLGPNDSEGVHALESLMANQGAIGLIDSAGLALIRIDQDVLSKNLIEVPAVLHEIDSTRYERVIEPLLGASTVVFRHDAQEIASMVLHGDAAAAILMSAPSVAQIEAAAYAGVRMSPKTTFFAPKPRTGLVFRSLKD